MKNKIVVTGASSEIGQAICKRLLQKGDEAVLQCFNHVENCLSIKERIGANCSIHIVDFNNLTDLENFCREIKGADILVNASAFTKTDLLVNLKEDEIKKMINVNIMAIIHLCRAVISTMVAKRHGCIVNISSVAATRGNRGQTVYGGTKGFIESFTKSLAAEYGSKGVRANCVAPGPIDAGSLKETLSYAKDEVMRSIVSKRLGSPDDVAATVAFLCSEDASFINGSCIAVDGGFMKGV